MNLLSISILLISHITFYLCHIYITFNEIHFLILFYQCIAQLTRMLKWQNPIPCLQVFTSLHPFIHKSVFLSPPWISHHSQCITSSYTILSPCLNQVAHHPENHLTIRSRYQSIIIKQSIKTQSLIHITHPHQSVNLLGHLNNQSISI